MQLVYESKQVTPDNYKQVYGEFLCSVMPYFTPNKKWQAFLEYERRILYGGNGEWTLMWMITRNTKTNSLVTYHSKGHLQKLDRRYTATTPKTKLYANQN